MKIKNEIISIKIGKKHYDFNNLILDEYLKRFVSSQLTLNNLNIYSTMKRLRYCLLKFDTPLKNISNSSEIKNQDFDICFVGGAIINQAIGENQIVAEYLYDTNWNVWDYKKDTATDNYLSNYYGKKVTAIGFNVTWLPYDFNGEGGWKHPVCAVLDTSNYNIYLQENQDLSITRKDIITTDAIFYSNSKEKVAGPAHLAPAGLPEIIHQNRIYNNDKTAWSSYEDNAYGILYSIGLSSYTDYIDEEFIIGTDVQVEQSANELKIKGIENYLSTDSSLFCGENVFPQTGLYPTKTNYKYVIFKYKVYQQVHSGTYEQVTEQSVDTGYFYHEAIPINKFGKSDFKITYERG